MQQDKNLKIAIRNMFKDLKEDINKSLNEVCENINKQLNEIMKTITGLKVDLTKEEWLKKNWNKTGNEKFRTLHQNHISKPH
jgi:chromosome segregation ATPase